MSPEATCLLAGRGDRRKRDMNLIQAFLWNVGTLHMMVRENPVSGGPTKGESIDAYSGGDHPVAVMMFL